nr:hypothetical protein [Tanacetum cinerariifolium]
PGCLFVLGEVEKMMGSRVRVVEWWEEWGRGGVLVGRKIGYKVNSSILKNVGGKGMVYYLGILQNRSLGYLRTNKWEVVLPVGTHITGSGNALCILFPTLIACF